MGLIANAFHFGPPQAAAAGEATRLPSGAPGLAAAGSAMGPGFERYAREGYQKNEIVYAAIELRATSAAEPHIVGRRYTSQKGRVEAKAKARWLDGAGVPRWMIGDVLTRNGMMEDRLDHPLVELLNNPNPFMSRFHLWSTVIMDRDLAGNAYLWKGRDGAGTIRELWRLRPDRVRVIPDREKFIRGYTYRVGGESIELPAEDVIHFKTRHPLDDYYGMPPLMAVASRVDIDNYMRDFVGAFFRNGGNPGAVLTVKQKLTQEGKDELRNRARAQFSGVNGAFEWLILDNTEATFTPITMGLGARGLVVPALNAISEARISMAFGIPGSILGLLIGYESSSYANKRADWAVLWDITLAPMYSDLDDVLNLAFRNERQFKGIDELVFDLSGIKALQEDVDKLHARARSNFIAGGWTLEEFRLITGMVPTPSEGTYFVPANVLPTPIDQVGEMPELAELEARALRAAMGAPAIPALERGRGRPRLEDDADAHEIYAQGEQLRREHPDWTAPMVADRIGISERTLRRYRDAFDDALDD